MNFKRFLGLIALVCVLACALSFMTACDTAAGGDDTSAETTTEAATTAGTTEPETSEEETTRGKLPHEILEEEETTVDTRTQYTIKVVDEEGNAISAVSVQYCTKESCSFGTSNAEGVITFESAVDDPTAYYIVVKVAPDGYAFDETQKFYFDENFEAIVTIASSEDDPAKEETTDSEEETTVDTRTQYTIKVVDEEGNALAGVVAQYCTDENCSFGTSNAEGVITFKSDITDPTAYYIAVKLAPEGYTFDEEQKFYFDENCEAIVTVAKSEA